MTPKVDPLMIHGVITEEEALELRATVAVLIQDEIPSGAIIDALTGIPNALVAAKSIERLLAVMKEAGE